MPSAKHPSAKPAATIVNATAKTRSVIEDLQARLTRDARGRVAPQTPPERTLDDLDHQETVEDLERQLQAYFERATPAHSSHAATATSSRTQILDELRNRVVDGVVDRILAEWADPQRATPGAGLGREVMDRLIERVLEEFRKTV